MCPDCVPDIYDDSNFMEVLFPICSGCLSAKPEYNIPNNKPTNKNVEQIPPLFSQPTLQSGTTEDDEFPKTEVCSFYLRKACKFHKDKTKCRF